MFEKKSSVEPLNITPVHLLSLVIEAQFIEPHEQRSFLRPSYFLPCTSSLTKDEYFADVALGWNHEGLSISLFVHQPFQGVALPAIEEGDALNLFIDTRDVKTTAYNTKFCHHFVIFPKEVEGMQAQEITHFRGSEKRAHCKPELIETHAKFSRNAYQIHVFLPKEALFGYDPTVCDHIGFSYKISRAHGMPQHFSCSSLDFKIEESPALWASIRHAIIA